MKFFLPYITDPKQEEETYTAIKAHVADQMHTNITNRRIFSIDYERDRKNFHIEVGQIYKEAEEMIITIFDSSLMYYVFNTNRGVVLGMPLIIDNYEIRIVTDFEE